MEKILSLGLTGKKLLAQGFLFVLLGLILMVTGTWLPVKVIRLVLFLAWIATVLDLVLRIFKKSQSTDTLGVALVKLLVLGYLLGSNLATDVPIYILALVIGVYQIFHASINLVTYVLYRKNKIRPRFRLLLDGLVLVFLGGTSLLSSTGNSVFQLFVLGAYFFLYGVSNIRDGFLFEEEIGKNHLKRRIRISLPIVLAALIPARTLAKVNKFMLENADEEEDIHLGIVKSGKTAELEIFVHTAETSLFSAIGHVDICYQGRVISYGNYDPSSETLFGQDVINFGEQLDEVYYYREGKQNFYDQLKFEVTSQDTVYQWRRQYVRENKNGVVPTLTANMGTGGHNVPLILTDSGEIRKLTPKETFNVQGYPKSFKIPEGVSNGQLYKQAGNSVVVPVIKRIAENVAKALNESQGQSQLDRSGKFAIIYTKMNGQFEGQSYVKDFVDSYDQALEKIKSYDDGLAVLSDEEYLRLVKKQGKLEFYSIN